MTSSRQTVRLDHGDAAVALEPAPQLPRKARVDLDRDHLAGSLGQGCGQPAGAGADLDHEVAAGDACGGGQLVREWAA